LWTDKKNFPKQVSTVKKYHDHLMSIKDDPKKILSHLYVRHFGDLSGGQMIAKRVPGSGKMYQFDGDPEAIKNILRAKLDDSLADEAIVCFDFAGKLFEQMMSQVTTDE
jgi:heme oxygenase